MVGIEKRPRFPAAGTSRDQRMGTLLVAMLARAVWILMLAMLIGVEWRLRSSGAELRRDANVDPISRAIAVSIG